MAKKLLSITAGALIASAFGTTVYLSNDSVKSPIKQGKSVSLPTVKIAQISLEEAVLKADELCQRVKDESGSPGLVVSVTVDGVLVYSKGFGYADVENHIQCKSSTVMRIASISKSITMAAVAKLYQEGSIIFDHPVQQYVPQFPDKYFDGEKVEITLRHLVSHLSGIRHYEKVVPVEQDKSSEDSKSDASTKLDEKIEKIKAEFDAKEYLINNYFESVAKSMTIFQDDELFSKPGTKFLYTTHGWTVVSAIVEAVVKKPFPQYMKSFFHEMGLKNTYLDENKPLIYNRAKYYIRNDKGRLENAPLVDNSYKWAGGGFLSTSEDLVKFGNAILYSFQNSNGFLNRNTAQMIWTPVANTTLAWDKDGTYGMGWGVVPATHEPIPFCKTRQFYASHTGGAIGASSVLLIYPRNDETTREQNVPVRGTVVAMIVNLQNVGLNQTALEIANLFDRVNCSEL